MSTLLPELKSLFQQHAQRLPGVSERKLFGCDGFFKDGGIFGLIWKTGRIGVKLPNPKSFDELMAKPGAELWMPSGEMAMGSWVLVPESFHDDEDQLGAWIHRAHAEAVPKAAKPPKKKAALMKATSPSSAKNAAPPARAAPAKKSPPPPASKKSAPPPTKPSARKR